jgi:hypothetical protein
MPGRKPIKVTTDISVVQSAELGAGACLTFLQQQEAKARESIVSAEKALADLLLRRSKNLRADDGKSPDEWDKEIRIAQSYIEIASMQHGKAADRLLKYEKAVAPEKRGDGERITQETHCNQLINCAVTLRMGWQQLFNMVCQNAPLCGTPTDAAVRFTPFFDEAMEAMIKSATSDGKIDSVSAKALTEGFL